MGRLQERPESSLGAALEHLGADFPAGASSAELSARLLQVPVKEVRAALGDLQVDAAGCAEREDLCLLLLDATATRGAARGAARDDGQGLAAAIAEGGGCGGARGGEEVSLLPGCAVRLFNLHSSPALNMQRARVVQFHAQTGRYEVRLDWDGSVKRVRYENLMQEEDEAGAHPIVTPPASAERAPEATGAAPRVSAHSAEAGARPSVSPPASAETAPEAADVPLGVSAVVAEASARPGVPPPASAELAPETASIAPSASAEHAEDDGAAALLAEELIGACDAAAAGMEVEAEAETAAAEDAASEASIAEATMEETAALEPAAAAAASEAGGAETADGDAPFAEATGDKTAAMKAGSAEAVAKEATAKVREEADGTPPLVLPMASEQGKRVASAKTVADQITPSRKPTKIRTSYSGGRQAGEPGRLVAALQALWHAQELCDVSLICGAWTLRAHKAVLAGQSKPLRALLEQGPEVRLEGVSHPEAGRLMLEYLYEISDDADYTPSSHNVNMEVLGLACRFGLPGLKRRAAVSLGRGVTSGNAAERLAACEEFGLPELRDRILDQLASSKKALAEFSSGDCAEANPRIMQEILRRVAGASGGQPPGKKARKA